MRKFVFCLYIIIFLSLGIVYAMDSGEDDASSVYLSSIAVSRTDDGFNHLRFKLKARKSGFFEPIIDINKSAQKSLEYFFIGLALPDSAFWVNLNPHEPERLIDQDLADTDLGRIMLSADLRLKEDFAECLNPQTSPVGREFWKRVYEKAKELGYTDKIPFTNKLWIIPDKALAVESSNQLSLVNCSLKVGFGPVGSLPLDNFILGLMKELIVPYIEKRVNESYAYADLREVYHALILSRWYRQKFGVFRGNLCQAVGFETLSETNQDYPIEKNEVYQDYLNSFKKGRYSFTERIPELDMFGTIIITRNYFSGGVDFKRIDLSLTDKQGESAQGELTYTCDLFIPEGIQHPLAYAKANLGLLKGDISGIVLAKNLPAIVPLNHPSEDSLRSLDSCGKMERLVLSKL
ncbi:MAG: hypothetical protein HY761_03230 [Candidatus Omnitrophica bacterium]|nr:hypothetical protein [Candidatus Omnitrophota bacterium]